MGGFVSQAESLFIQQSKRDHRHTSSLWRWLMCCACLPATSLYYFVPELVLSFVHRYRRKSEEERMENDGLSMREDFGVLGMICKGLSFDKVKRACGWQQSLMSRPLSNVPSGRTNTRKKVRTGGEQKKESWFMCEIVVISGWFFFFLGLNISSYLVCYNDNRKNLFLPLLNSLRGKNLFINIKLKC